MANEKYGIGSFAEGLARGIEAGTKSRRWRAGAKAIETENARQGEIDTLRGDIQAIDPARLQGGTQELEGPPSPDAGGPTYNPAQHRQQLANKAKMLGDEGSYQVLGEMGVQAAMAHLNKARTSGDPAAQAKALLDTNDMLGFELIKQNEDGEIVDRAGNPLSDEKVLNAAMFEAATAFQNPETRAMLNANYTASLRAEGREDKRLGFEQAALDQADARIDLAFADQDLARQRFRASVEQFADQLELNRDELDSLNGLRDAQITKLLSDAAYTDARLTAAGKAPLDPEKALKFYNERVKISQDREHPLYEQNEGFRQHVGTLADTFLMNTELGVSPETAITAAEEIVAHKAGLVPKLQVTQDGDNFYLNDTALPENMARAVANYITTSANEEAPSEGGAQQPPAGSGGLNDPYMIPKAIRGVGERAWNFVPSLVNPVVESFRNYDWFGAGEIIVKGERSGK